MSTCVVITAVRVDRGHKGAGRKFHVQNSQDGGLSEQMDEGLQDIQAPRPRGAERTLWFQMGR